MTRIETVVSYIEPCSVFADVGCDHGYIARGALLSGKCASVIASDISEKCLEKARRTLADFDNVKFVCCDGIKYAADEAAICGMGGDVIARIIDGCNVEKLILSPHTRAHVVRDALVKNNYAVTRDTMLFDKKYYTVIFAKKSGAREKLSELQLMFGAFFDTDDLTKQVLENKRRQLLQYKQTAQNKKKLSLIEEALKCLR